MINTLIFDLDRTLLNLDSSELNSLKYLFHNHFETSVDFNLFFKIYREFNDLWWFKKSRYEATEIEVKQNRFRDTLKKLNITTTLSLQEISDLYFENAKDHWHLYDGAERILKDVVKKYKTAMITNGFTKTQNQKIKSLNIAHYFQYICLSEDVGFSKPDKRIFDHTLNQISSISNEAVYIGDDYDNDILGALNADIKPIWFNPDKKENPDNVIEFQTYSELQGILKKL